MVVELVRQWINRSGGQSECVSWALPISQEQLNALLGIRGIYALHVTQREAAYVRYVVARPLTLDTVLKGRVRREPWLHAIIGALSTDPSLSANWEFRVSQAAEDYIDELMSDEEFTLEDVPETLRRPAWASPSLTVDMVRSVEEDPQSREELFDFAADDIRKTGDFEFSSEEVEVILSRIGKE